MANFSAGIAAFVSVRLNGPVSDSFLIALEGRVKQESGCTKQPPEGAEFSAVFGRATSALAFVRFVHTELAKDNSETKNETLLSVGIECGEYPAVPTKRIAPLERSAEL